MKKSELISMLRPFNKSLGFNGIPSLTLKGEPVRGFVLCETTNTKLQQLFDGSVRRLAKYLNGDVWEKNSDSAVIDVATFSVKLSVKHLNNPFPYKSGIFYIKFEIA